MAGAAVKNLLPVGSDLLSHVLVMVPKFCELWCHVGRDMSEIGGSSSKHPWPKTIVLAGAGEAKEKLVFVSTICKLAGFNSTAGPCPFCGHWLTCSGLSYTFLYSYLCVHF